MDVFSFVVVVVLFVACAFLSGWRFGEKNYEKSFIYLALWISFLMHIVR